MASGSYPTDEDEKEQDEAAEHLRRIVTSLVSRSVPTVSALSTKAAIQVKFPLREVREGQRFLTCLTQRRGVVIAENNFAGVRVALSLLDDVWPDHKALDYQRVEVLNLSPSVVVLAVQA